MARFLGLIGSSLLAALVLAGALSLLGTGFNFTATFSMILLVFLLGGINYFMTTAPPAPVGGVAPLPYIGRGTARVLVAVVTAMVLFSIWPVFKAALYANRPLTMQAAIELARRNDLTTAIYLTPLDTGMQDIVDQTRKTEAARATVDLQARIDKLNAERPDESDTVRFASWNVKMERLLQEKAARINRVDQKWRLTEAPKPAAQKAAPGSMADRFDGLKRTVLGTPGIMPYVLIGIMGVALMWLGTALIKNAKLATAWSWAVVFITALTMTLVYQDKDPRYAGATGYVGFVPLSSVTSTPDPVTVAIDGGQMPSYESRWVSTGITIDKVSTVRVNEFNLVNPGMPKCSASGCATAQINGPRISNGSRHMMVLGRIGEGMPFEIGTGTTVYPEKVGSGELLVTVNQAKEDSAWENMKGGFAIKVQ